MQYTHTVHTEEVAALCVGRCAASASQRTTLTRVFARAGWLDRKKVARVIDSRRGAGDN